MKKRPGLAHFRKNNKLIFLYYFSFGVEQQHRVGCGGDVGKGLIGYLVDSDIFGSYT